MNKYVAAIIGGILGMIIGYMLALFINSKIPWSGSFEAEVVLLICVITCTIVGAKAGWNYGD